ncbi:DUF2955 family protein [Pseudoxanthomonas sp. 3HH-4]|uniref:DUF2955 domain-containing protein n=1 Tax=Pseudoxanthomonas sp. 3HH-4 TaxID=1690214 RepID=UPI00116E220C|nr:DUF2955 domain-containing protein [Pseudoxanthomonas sp. 3HH-4]TQM12106.1 DUF2955 family protein [Pseudoxanthomonas sp. 3HH-4]
MSVATIDAGLGEQGRLAALRLAFAGTSCLLVCEAMQWTPTFLAPVLVVVLLGNLPGRPPAKAIVALTMVTAVSALGSFVLASLLRFIPVLLVAAIALLSLLCFHSIAAGKPVFPALLALICLATIPVAVMVAPAQAGALPLALIRGIAMALAGVWVAHALWPATRVRSSPPVSQPRPDPVITPLARALVSVAVVMPVMLVYLLFGLADVLPVLVATVMLVVTFDARRSLLQAVAMVLGNLAGGFIGLLLYAVLLITPNLALLALLVFTALLFYGGGIARGGPMAPVMLIACNATLIIFSSAIATGPAPLSIWWGRLFQFAVAGAFSVAAMSFFWRYHGAVHGPR